MKRFKDNIYGIILLLIIIYTIINSRFSKAGAINGFELCTNIIIPSLLPILVLTSTLTFSNGSYAIELLFGWFTKNILRLPKVCTSAIILGLLGGYPTGAVLTNQLYEQELIDENTAKRILRFNFSGGVAFIITAVGTVQLKSQLKGFILYIITLISTLLIAIIEGLFYQRTNYYNKKKNLDLSQATAKAIESSVKSVTTMCCYIILFSAIINTIKLPKASLGFVEITNGVFSGEYSFEMLACILSFGGFCVHFQLIGILKNANMKYYDFLLHRVASGIISYFLGKVFIYFHPNEQAVFSNVSETIPKAFQVNIGLSVVFVLGLIVFIFDINNKKSKLL